MNESKPDINKVLFMHMVSMLAMSAIQQMGKLVDPGTGKAETNLEAAQATIDMLDMLEARTRGNLDAEETRLIKDTLMSLKMNYVQSQEQKTDDRRQTTDGGSAKAESGTEKQTPNAEGGKTDDRRRTTDGGPAKAESGTEKQTPNAEGGKTDDGQRTTDGGPAKAEGEKPASGAEENKTPKYHKKYE